MISKKKKIMFDLALMIGTIFLGTLILVVSLIRTSLNTVLKEEKENKLRTEPVEFLMPADNGVLEKNSYKLPNANILSGNILYLLKGIREDLWIRFANNPIDKSKISLLIADKKISEYRILIKSQKTENALKAIQEALDKLKYSEETIENINANKIEISQLSGQIFKAGFAYKEVLKDDQQIFEKFKNSNEKYKQMVFKLNEWNRKQTQKRKTAKN